MLNVIRSVYKMDSRKCTACNRTIDKDNQKTNRTVCEHSYNRRQGNNSFIVPEQQNNQNNANVSAYEDHRNVIVGPSNSGRTYYFLKVLKRIDSKRAIQIVGRSPNQCSIFETSIGIKPSDNYKGSVINFVELLGAQKNS